jgi:succinylarginine dihydrolase
LSSFSPPLSFEINFDGLVGPTHNFAGLSLGNIASVENRYAVSNPRKAVKEGLEKMRFLVRLGIRQALLPPLFRPNLPVLRDLGFLGRPEKILREAGTESPQLLTACYSASSMWAANAATVTPSADSDDRKVHFTPANLISNFHRSIEAKETADLLKAIFRDGKHFTHHTPLPATSLFSDEGAANHIRFAPKYGEPGLHLFVYGRTFSNSTGTARFPQRQAEAACAAIVRNHRLPKNRVIYAQQHPDAIEAGVFHNDVISTGNLNLFLYHRSAFIDSQGMIQELKAKYLAQHNKELLVIEIDQFSLADAVDSYLFNSQIISAADDRMILIAPKESEEIEPVREVVAHLLSDPECPIQEVYFLDLRQSMRNGGGPACLRNRIVLNEVELGRLPKKLVLIEPTIDSLVGWADRHYRERLAFPDLFDPDLLAEVQTALDELTQILELGSIYEFQRC